MKLESAIQELNQASLSAFSTINEAIRAIVAAAQTSELTGLPNFLAFEADFITAQKSDRPHCLLFGDLNGFKSINDDVSHEAGDAALRRAGTILELIAHNWHGNAYHKSGDEFAILVPSKHKSGLGKELEQYFALITLPFDEHHLEFSGSFGCVEIANTGMKQAQERAERACQIAKLAGRGRVVHQWSASDTLDAVERRLRCSQCGTAFRCTLAPEVERPTLYCPSCQSPVANSVSDAV